MGDRMKHKEAAILVNLIIEELRTHIAFNEWWKTLVMTDCDRDLVDRLRDIVQVEE